MSGEEETWSTASPEAAIVDIPEIVKTAFSARNKSGVDAKVKSGDLNLVGW